MESQFQAQRLHYIIHPKVLIMESGPYVFKLQAPLLGVDNMQMLLFVRKVLFISFINKHYVLVDKRKGTSIQ